MLLKLFPLWENTSKDGNTYFSTKLNNKTKLLMLKNKYKKKDTDPDYYLYASEISNDYSEDDKDNVDDDIPFWLWGKNMNLLKKLRRFETVDGIEEFVRLFECEDAFKDIFNSSVDNYIERDEGKKLNDRETMETLLEYLYPHNDYYVNDLDPFGDYWDIMIFHKK